MAFRAGSPVGTNSEHDRLLAVQQNAVFDMPAHGPREHHLFQVTPFADEVVDGVAMGYSDHVLLDDGAIVEDFGDIVAGSANQLHAALECLMVRPGANECRQK